MNTISQRNQFPARAAEQLAADTRAAERANQEIRRQAIARHVADKKLEGTVTRERLEGADYVRDRYGWWRVIRVSAKSVTVEGEFDDRRIAIDRIREVR